MDPMTRTRPRIAVEFASHRFELLGGPALWWPCQRTLIVADVHLGKGAAFRSAGVPVPAGTSNKDLQRLTQFLAETEAERLIILGDFLHSRTGRHPQVMDAVCQWRRSHEQIEVTLIVGNHDRSAGACPEEWKLDQIKGSVEIDGLFLSHFPDTPDCKPLIAGHIHPVCTLRDFDRSAVRVPCFVFDDQVGVLPAFGSFTGGHYVPARDRRRIFAIAGEIVIPLPCGRKKF
jgi:DNA ligase-associated metallophosphoesterase